MEEEEGYFQVSLQNSTLCRKLDTSCNIIFSKIIKSGRLEFSIVTLLNDFCALKTKKPKQLARRVSFILALRWPIVAVQNAFDSCQCNLAKLTIPCIRSIEETFGTKIQVSYTHICRIKGCGGAGCPPHQ